MEKIYVSRAQLHELYLNHGVWNDLWQGHYTCEEPRDKKHIPVKEGHRPEGGEQIWHKWKDIFGRHIVTTHCVMDAEGWPVHWDEKDLIVNNVKYIHLRDLDWVYPCDLQTNSRDGSRSGYQPMG